MNDKQKIILLMMGAIIFTMLVFPPFDYTQEGIIVSLGYGFLLSPPEYNFQIGSVNIGLLFFQWVGVIVIGAIVYFTSKD